MLSIQPCPSVQWFDSLQQNGYISSVIPLLDILVSATGENKKPNLGTKLILTKLFCG